MLFPVSRLTPQHPAYWRFVQYCYSLSVELGRDALHRPEDTTLWFNQWVFALRYNPERTDLLRGWVASAS